MCNDLERTLSELRAKSVEITRPVEERRYGRFTALRVPGGNELGLYEPRHPRRWGSRRRELAHGGTVYAHITYRSPYCSGACASRQSATSRDFINVNHCIRSPQCHATQWTPALCGLRGARRLARNDERASAGAGGRDHRSWRDRVHGGVWLSRRRAEAAAHRHDRNVRRIADEGNVRAPRNAAHQQWRDRARYTHYALLEEAAAAIREVRRSCGRRAVGANHAAYAAPVTRAGSRTGGSSIRLESWISSSTPAPSSHTRAKGSTCSSS